MSDYQCNFSHILHDEVVSTSQLLLNETGSKINSRRIRNPFLSFLRYRA